MFPAAAAAQTKTDADPIKEHKRHRASTTLVSTRHFFQIWREKEGV
jgi:hypothetical protein